MQKLDIMINRRKKWINIKIVFLKNIKNCKDADLIILHTEWDEFKSIDFKKINKNKRLKIFDLRNLFNVNEMKSRKIEYYSIGRPSFK